MEDYNYDPTNHLHEIFNSPDSLDELPQLLSHVNQYKLELSKQIKHDINTYNSQPTRIASLNSNISSLIKSIEEVKSNANETQTSITLMTSSIQQLDCYKKNLVLSMTILKRLQMLINVNNQLSEIIHTHNYKEIHSLLGVVKQLLTFFKPFKSIDEINQINLLIIHSQNKLIDDIFIDFEEYVKSHNIDLADQLIYGCEILQLIDVQYKEKLTNWFYNLKLKDFKTIFNNFDEAGSLDNLNRRFIYFNKILTDIQQNYKDIFPENWKIDHEISIMFCKLTKQDLTNLLPKHKSDSKIILENLTKTLEFEKSLNASFQTNEFNQLISSVFEPYLFVWVQEQDKLLNTKILEFSSSSQLPIEFQESKDILTILKVNNVPNLSNSCTELFKNFHKILTQILKLSNGEILIELAKLFSKYLFEYHNRILLPLIPMDEDLTTNESLKYLTMILNTGDYLVNNIDDLSNKFQTLVQSQYKSRIPSFDSSQEIYSQLINKCISKLIVKLTNDYRICWREFFNMNWQSLDQVNDVSSYMSELKSITLKNIQIILPLIIRESFIRNFNDKLIEHLVHSIANNLKSIKPLTVLSVEQILLDVYSLKDLALKLPLYADPNYSEASDKTCSKSYEKFVVSNFHNLESLLKLLIVPSLPIETLIESYFELIGDKSITNFIKVLNLKEINNQFEYIENFKLQLTIGTGDLQTSNKLLQVLEEEEPIVSGHSSRGVTPIPEVMSPMLLPAKKNLNQFERNLREFAMTGENHVNKLNENFKNFGKFFRKESD
ncbi:protein required for protein sorting at the late Golgi [Spathaspora passalidarum NRRL Y-27907]|uniref:Protein required for protein sorting at the late Golgi n=1 Tax=Spathaspora passalidarum (strain NRRL Y-27907 / 11-Y1) TaxID=619300 RepID=G3AGV2_SPAPN|nr:protein required for protein sorting at the late Golgi [Spathaspora passalidarum NRRL Y-27907]EGW34625.1 protein required for protein sorting at the late Golgi [Spathaspora passalidarum NRRL Y-27907]